MFEEGLKEAEHVLCSVNRAWRISLAKGRINQYGYLKCNGGGSAGKGIQRRMHKALEDAIPQTS